MESRAEKMLLIETEDSAVQTTLRLAAASTVSAIFKNSKHLLYLLHCFTSKLHYTFLLCSLVIAVTGLTFVQLYTGRCVFDHSNESTFQLRVLMAHCALKAMLIPLNTITSVKTASARGLRVIALQPFIQAFYFLLNDQH
ncbi:Hypothetical_protein [Hexamita inflata]|uniref:Hypothetical_protein n=1 Tax=Hexamita inflata TaxID=28002 RepID=A0AA86UJ49_9EUKA|nr:Hypothetical protein HINF_LOCUS29627 [Hexamita inflata]CAI9941983.1 Hypothetical protein HINF_LOCUS29628 [Hexamita inflata]